VIAAYKPRVRIRASSAGFVEPSLCANVMSASIFDGDIERVIAEAASVYEFPAGLYLAEWEDERGAYSRYIFRVNVETREDRSIEVEP
jgi:hypothetical protein